MATSKAAVKTAAKPPVAAPKAEKKATEVAVREMHALAADIMADITSDAGKGMEHVDADSVAIPFLAVLQKTSPQCDPDDGAYIPEAKPGMLMNTVTKQLFDGKEGLLFVPCAYHRKFLRWAPREGGGGFKGEVPIDQIAKLRDQGLLVELENRLYVPDESGNINPKKCDRVADTRVHYILILNPTNGLAQQAVISLASTQIKKSKQLMALLSGVQIEADGRMIAPATFANMVRITTVPESNDKGSWSGCTFDLEGFVKDGALYAMARSFHKLVSAGRANVNYDAAPGVGDADDDGGASHPDNGKGF